MPIRLRWLKPEEWDKFEELFEAVEGTGYYDVKELALNLVGEKNPDLERELRNNKENISTILLEGGLANRNMPEKKEAA